MSSKTIDWVAVEEMLASQRVTHESFEHALARAKQLVREIAADQSPVGVAILGDSRVGKSTVLKAVSAAYPAHRLDDGVRMPVVYVEVPSNPTVLGLAEAILLELGDPRAHKGSKANRTMRVKKRLKDVGCRVLALDELQHIQANAGDRTKYGTSDFLKEVMDGASINLLVAGLPAAQRVIYLNEQLRGRFSRTIQLKRFDWMDLEDKAQFQSVLKQWREMFPMLDMPVLEEEAMAFRFFCASGGLIGYVYKILHQAIWNAADDRNPVITLLDLEYAHLQAVEPEEPHAASPFSKEFKLTDVPKLVADAKKIGQHIEPTATSRSTQAKAESKEPKSAYDALHVG